MDCRMQFFKCVVILLSAQFLCIHCRAAELGGSDSNSSLSQSKTDGRQIIKKLVEVNKYWLIGPNPDVHNYSYEFKTQSASQPKTFTVDNPLQAKQAVRQSITYYSLLNEIAQHPENIKSATLETKDSLIELTVSLTKSVKTECGNRIEAGKSFGYFSNSMAGGTIWIDPNRMVPLKATIGNIEETYDGYVSAGQNHWVPQDIKIDGTLNCFDFRFKFYKPGLWLFDRSDYTIKKIESREGSEHPNIVSVSNVKINGTAAQKKR
jgi:hypothetical protein